MFQYCLPATPLIVHEGSHCSMLKCDASSRNQSDVAERFRPPAAKNTLLVKFYRFFDYDVS
jgi:hypothetical protein